MTIGKKILLGFGLALALMLVLGLVAYRNTNTIYAVSERAAESGTHVRLLEETISDLKDMETGQRGYLLTGDLMYLEPFESGSRNIQAHLREVRGLFTSPEDRSRLEALTAAVNAKTAVSQQTIQLRREKGLDAALQIVRTNMGKKYMNDARAIVADLDREEIAALEGRRRDAADAASATRNTFLGLTAFAFVVVGGIGMFIHRSITRPLVRYMGVAEKVGIGDLRVDAAAEGSDELARLGRSLNQMIVGLKNLAEQTRSATVNLNSATAEILASTQEQAASTGEQAAAVQETTVTMEEIRQSGMQITERAKQVAAAATATAGASTAGLSAVQNTGRAMEGIREQAEAVAENIVRLSEKTQAIGEIIATVNDIAEQSHLLALNAAIEAAAAGEHGRSFAVVASEIRNMADQSKQATVQVRSILGEIQRGINSSVMLTEEAVKRIEAGKQHSETAERTIRQMADSIQQSVQAFQQIVAGSNQQHIGFEQVVQAIKNIGQASQQNATATRQLEQAAANLNALGQQLKAMGEAYRI